MTPTIRWPLGLALLAWIVAEATLVSVTPRCTAMWRDGYLAARGGMSSWRLLFTWGVGSRWVQAAPRDRQAFTDGCGAAVLSALLQRRGVVLPQSLLWNLTRLPEGGTTLQRMTEVARCFGVDCHVLRLSPEGTLHPRHGSSVLPLPRVLHLRRAHFVLLLRTRPSRVRLLDPALGLIDVPARNLQRQVSGLVFTCAPPIAGRSVEHSRGIPSTRGVWP